MDACINPLPSFRHASGRNPDLRPTAWIQAQSLSPQALGGEPCRNDAVGSASPKRHNASLSTSPFIALGVPEEHERLRLQSISSSLTRVYWKLLCSLLIEIGFGVIDKEEDSFSPVV